MARRIRGSAKGAEESGDDGVRGAPLKPIRVVKRELTRPDGTKLTVDVPVYPPFRLEDRAPPKPRSRKVDPPAKAKASGDE